MHFRKLLIVILICCTTLVSCKISFTCVMDTTGSMRNQISVIQRNMVGVVNEVNNFRDVENFILLTFSDPEIGNPVYAPTPENFITALNRVTVKGGGECPENSLSAIEKGLEISHTNSYIFVFTDAYAKDLGKLENVENLCRSTGSKVVIFLNGYCDRESAQDSSMEAYYRVAKSCRGAFFRMDLSSFRHKAFALMKELIKTNWTEIVTHDTFNGYNEVTIQIDPFTTEFLVVVYGNFPQVRITSKFDTNVYYEKLHETRHFTVLRLHSGESEYKLQTRSQGPASMTFYKKLSVPFIFGFSPRIPFSMKETSILPLPVRTVNLIVPAVQVNLDISSVEINIFDGNKRRVLTLDKSDSGNYMISTSFATNGLFQITITATDRTSYEQISSSTRMLKSQKQSQMPWHGPTVEILAEDTVRESGEEVVIPCKVTGHPKPKIKWESDDGEELPSSEIVLEMSSVYILYGTVTSLTRNMTVYCKARNREEEVTRSISLNVKRTNYIDEIQIMKDISVEYGEESKLFCQVNANPEPKITWYQNDTLIEYNDRITVNDDGSSITIKSMDMEDAGNYKCRVRTTFESKDFSAKVDITGLEPPRISAMETEINAQLNDAARLECTLHQGKPVPVVTWTFKSLYSDYYSSIPMDVTVNDKVIEISALKTEHAGTYKCESSNSLGQDSKEIVVHVQSPPIIKTISEAVEKTEGDFIELVCEAEGDPKPQARWEFTQDDTVVSLDDRHATDDRNTHRFTALWKDSGNYHCIAENRVGKAEKTVSVNILVRPHIVRPAQPNITVSTGSYLTLKCDIDYGNPVPDTRWEFIAADSTASVLSRGKLSNDWQISNVSPENEGSYKCRADNIAGFDHIEVQLHVV